MNKTEVVVPKGIEYLSDWKGFSLPDHPCIIDKKLTGCGFTEYVLRGSFPACLISPRRPLLENKIAQHNPKDEQGKEIIDERRLYYARSDEDRDLGVDKDLQNNSGFKSTAEPKEVKLDPEEAKKMNETYKQNLRDAISKFIFKGKPIKICVTYDSFRKVKEVLQKDFPWLLEQMYFVVDEFQSIFTDSKFKSDTELGFVHHLQDLQRVSFVSATPMMEEYLDLINEFNTLPYYEFDWTREDPTRVITPEIVARGCKSINEVAKKIISEFKSGVYQKKTLVDNNGVPIDVVESKELIIYINSIKNICDIIKQNQLTYEVVNIICAKTIENAKKIRKAFQQVYKEIGRNSRDIPKEEFIIGSVPTPDPVTGDLNNKPITLCTKTVYLGADFYSTNARSIVLSDSGVDCLAVDITLDLPQILGRQRLITNPWKNSLEVWFRLGNGVGDISEEEFMEFIEKKKKNTENLLSLVEKGTPEEKHTAAEKYLRAIKVENYKNDYLAVNQYAGNDLKPQFNNLVMIAEKRAFDIQQKDYKDRFTVFNRIGKVFGDSGVSDISKDIEKLDLSLRPLKQFPEKMKKCCDWVIEKGSTWANYLPEPFRTYILTLGIDFIVSGSYRKYNLDEAMIQRGAGRIFTPEDTDEVVTGFFTVGARYTNQFIKSSLQEIYTKLGLPKKAIAKDIEKWFDVKVIKLTNKETGKRDFGYEILNLKQ